MNYETWDDAPRQLVADETDLRALLQQLYDAWAAGDADAYAAFFTEDADYLAFDGVTQKGRAAIAEAHRPLFEKWLRGSRLTGEVTQLRWLGPDVALLHATGDTIMAGKTTPDTERASVQTLIALRQTDGQAYGWRFTSFQNTRVRPIDGLRGVLLWRMTDLLWRFFGSRNRSETQPKGHPHSPSPLA